MSQSNEEYGKYGDEVKKLFTLQHKIEKEHEVEDEEELAWQIKKLEEIEDELFGLDA